VWAGSPGTAHATETDQYYAIDKSPRDSLGVLNEKVNRDILGALELVNRGDWEGDSCLDVSHRVYQRFRISGLHKIELWTEHTPRVARVPADEESSLYLKKHSLYRNDRLWDWGLTFGVKATFNVAGVHMGADKLSHFFQTGWKYHELFLEHRQEGVPEREALERLIHYGVETEQGSLGLVTTEVFSFGDLEANYQGFLFYRGLCEGESPRLQKTAGGWRLVHPFDWREYVSPRFDESYNNSAFTPKRWREVQANLRQDYCPRLDSEAFREHYWRASHFARGPDEFSARYVQELIARGEVPRQADYSLWAACGRSPPDLGPGEAVAQGGSPRTPPRYDAPRFNDAILRPVFELGGGGFQGARSDWNALLRMRFVLRETVVPEDAWDSVRTPEYLLWGSFEGTLAVTPGPVGGLTRAALPHADLSLTPVEQRFELNDAASGDTLVVGVVLAPVRLTRFLAMDRKLGLALSVAGARGRLGTSLGEQQRMRVFASLALDALGYKAALHLSGLEAFHGVHLVTLGAEAGAELLLASQLRLGLVLGGRAELGLGWSHAGGRFSAPSDLGAYAEAQADVTSHLRLFVRGQLDALGEPEPGRTLSAPALLAGAVFRF
jgi:hypothetical protein